MLEEDILTQMRIFWLEAQIEKQNNVKVKIAIIHYIENLKREFWSRKGQDNV